MKLVIALTAVFLFSIFFHKPSRKLVWSDEFNYTGLPDSTKWNFDIGNGCPDLCGWGNNEKQYYTNRSQNVRVENGNLIIEVHPCDTTEYTSARLTSLGKGGWLYGKVEVRARLPKGRGTWPAIWMLPSEWKYGVWPNSGEIDIMEHVGFDHGRVHGTVHTESFNHLLGTQKGKSIELEEIDKDFHVYSIEWDENGISFLVDDVEFNHFENTKNGYKEWPFNQPFYLILNVAMGGDWGGKEGVDDSVLPQRMEIDYVRVYQ